MKRLFAIIIFLFVTCIGIILSLSNNESYPSGQTVEEAIERSGRQVEEIIHSEKVNDGEVVFYYKSINGGITHSLAAGYVQRTLSGWKWIIGGEHSVSSEVTSQYFPSTEGYVESPFPMAFGEIIRNDIVSIGVLTMNSEEKKARIIDNKEARVWFVFLNPSDGALTKLIGYNQVGEIMYSSEYNSEPINQTIDVD